MTSLNDFLRSYMPPAAVIITSILLVAHTLDLAFLNIDWITVTLLALLVLLPYTPRLKSVSVANFGIELRKARERVEKNLEDEEPAEGLQTDTRAEELYALLEEEPLLAVARARLVLTDLIRGLAQAEDIEVAASTTPQIALHNLEQQTTLSPGLADAAREALRVGSMAVNQGEITTEEATEAVDLTLEVIKQLRTHYRHQVLAPIDEVDISSPETEEYRGAKYRVQSIVPLVDNPKMITRIVPQSGLDAILEAYEECGEFLVRIEKIEETEIEESE